MFIKPGKYSGAGNFRRDGDKSSSAFDCVVEIFNDASAFSLTGHWHHYSRKRKRSFSVSINKRAGGELENVSIEYNSYLYSGALNSLKEYATGLFVTEQRTEILAVTVQTLNDGYRISGTLLAKNNAMFDVKVLSTDPQIANSNVVGLAG